MLLAAAGSLPVLSAVTADERTAALRGLLPRDFRAARALGERYLESEPAERSADWLAGELFGDPSLLTTDLQGRDWLKRRIRARCARDFRQGDLVLLEGWLLARTEARLLALCAVLPIS